MKTKNISFLILTLLLAISSFAQITVDINTYTPAQLVQTKLLNGCITASNITFQGDANQIGYFSATGTGATALGFPVNNSGIILSSGDSQEAIGPNASGSTSGMTTANIQDPQLDAISGGAGINDCAVLEFDFTPQSDTVQFRYIFASEEYPEFVNSFNDAFGFFISGPNPGGGNYINENIALVPGTTTPVTINNINNGTSVPTIGPCVNCAYYVDNSVNTFNVEYDGYTTVLTATIVVTMCQLYHIKLAVGDALDQSYDSSVFLEEGSFSSGTSVIMNNFTAGGNQTNTVYEGCSNYYDFCRLDTTNLAGTVDLPVNLGITGTAINGTDITTFPTNIIIPAGQACVSINYDGILDAATDPGEYVVLELLSGCPCNPTPAYDTIFVVEIPIIQGGITQNDTLICGTGGGGNITFNAWTNLDPTVTTYAWSTGANTQNITVPIPTGTTTYYVTITDVCNQMTVDSVNVSFSDLTIDFAGNNISCNGFTDGDITATPTNGQAPFNYSWNNGGNTNNITGLAAGTYFVTITDAFGCPGDSSFTIIEPTLLETSLATVNLLCIEDNSGEVRSNSTGGTPNYTYLWSDGSVLQNAINLAAGTYTVTVTDNQGCTVVETATITQPSKILLTGSKQDILCHGDGAGSAVVQAQGGTPGYNYLWNTGATTPSVDTLFAGVYNVTITDRNNCSVDTFFIITQGPEITYTNSSSPTSCFNYSDGTATLIPAGGTAPFSYLWSNATTNQSVTNVMSGNYEVTVTDANGCHNNFSIFVDQPTEVISSVNSDLTICIGESTILHTSATGGVPPYTHHWDNGSALQDITVNPVVTSSYIAYAEDINGCISESVEVTVIVNPPLEIDISISDYYACDGDPVVLTSIISGGNGNYTLTLEDGTIIPNTYSYFPTNNVKELIKVTVTDNCGTPTTFDTISVNILPLPEFTLQPNITQGCEPLDVKFMPFSNANNYSYSWNFGDEYNSNNISN